MADGVPAGFAFITQIAAIYFKVIFPYSQYGDLAYAFVVVFHLSFLVVVIVVLDRYCYFSRYCERVFLKSSVTYNALPTT